MFQTYQVVLLTNPQTKNHNKVSTKAKWKLNLNFQQNLVQEKKAKRKKKKFQNIYKFGQMKLNKKWK